MHPLAAIQTEYSLWTRRCRARGPSDVPGNSTSASSPTLHLAGVSFWHDPAPRQPDRDGPSPGPPALFRGEHRQQYAARRGAAGHGFGGRIHSRAGGPCLALVAGQRHRPNSRDQEDEMAPRETSRRSTSHSPDEQIDRLGDVFLPGVTAGDRYPPGGMKRVDDLAEPARLRRSRSAVPRGASRMAFKIQKKRPSVVLVRSWRPTTVPRSRRRSWR